MTFYILQSGTYTNSVIHELRFGRGTSLLLSLSALRQQFSAGSPFLLNDPLFKNITNPLLCVYIERLKSQVLERITKI